MVRMARPERPIVIAHRGASGYRPEHTLASYQLAIDMGADFIEPDLVSTRDRVLVARHENEISGTTDVAEHPEFKDRRTTKVIDGRSVDGWFTEDFTLEELKTLRARERLPQLRPQNTAHDGLFEVLTLQEIIDLAKANEREGDGRRIGIYPETKYPSYFGAIGLSLEGRLVDVLHANGYQGKDAPIFIQSFEVGNLQKLSRLTELPLIQLMDAGGRPYDFAKASDPRTYQDMVSPAGLAEVAGYADGIGVQKDLIVPREAAGSLLPATSLVRDAQAQGLLVHAWTFRRENYFLPSQMRLGERASPAYEREPGDLATEIALFLELGLDGFFTDNPDIGVAARGGSQPGSSR